jgi:hypothetical protein
MPDHISGGTLANNAAAEPAVVEGGVVDSLDVQRCDRHETPTAF